MSYANNSNAEFLKKAREIIEENLSNELFGVSELAKEMGISRSYLHRKIYSGTKLSVSRFIRQIRLKKAKELLRNTSYTVSEVAFNVGYSSVSYFSKCYHDFYGYSPGEERSRQEQEMERKVPVSALAKKNNLLRKYNLVTVLSLLVILILVFIYVVQQKKDLEKSIVVLPPNYLAVDSTNHIELSGIVGLIINKLSNIDDFDKVIPWISVQEYANTKKTLKEIARELKVNCIITSSLIKMGGINYLSVEMVDGNSGHQEWSEYYELDKSELMKLPSVIVNDIADEINADITLQERKQIEKIPTLNDEAFTSYVRGRVFWNSRTIYTNKG